MASFVVLVTPPRVPLVGDGLMYAFMSLDSSVIRVLSPKRDPPLVQEDGSTASTDNLCPRSVSIFPKHSMKVDFPAPGGPDNLEM